MPEHRSETPVNPQSLRSASFPLAIRGYDRDAVHALLERVAEALERGEVAAADGAPDVKRELERVGERTAGILTAAEQAAESLRAEAQQYAERVRQEAEEDARRARLEAARRAEQMVTEAEGRAERIIDDAIARRHRLTQAVANLAERRDEIADETARLAEELLRIVDALRIEEDEAAELAAAAPQDQAAEEPAADEPAEEPVVEEPEGAGASVNGGDPADEPTRADISDEPTQVHVIDEQDADSDEPARGES